MAFVFKAMRYCSTFDVSLFSQVEWQQTGFANLADYNNWIHGTLIYKAMDFVDNYCRHNFQLNAGTIMMDGTGKETQHISPHAVTWGLSPPPTTAPLTSVLPANLMPIPLMDIISVSIDSGANVAASCQTYNAYITRKNNIFPQGRQNVALVAFFGYGTIPHDIQYVTAQLCSNVLSDMVRRRMFADLMTPIMEAGGDISVLFRSPRVLTNNEKSILNKYCYHAMEIT